MSAGARLLGKNVLITGASSGIGAACAVEFARAGSNLVLAARRLERLAEVADACREANPAITIHPVRLDVRDRAAVMQAVAALPAPFAAGLDVLVNNAGLALATERVEGVAEADLTTMLDTNVKGLLYAIQAVLPGMKARNAGYIINVSSISGREVYPGGGVYCATKHAVDALTRTLRLELVHTPIRVCSIDPGLVETEFAMVRFGGDEARAAKVYEGIRPLSAHDVAEVVVFAASRPLHVQLASALVLPTHQASVSAIHRTGPSSSS